jgi:hypothetical protein
MVRKSGEQEDYRALFQLLREIARIGQHPGKDDTLHGFASHLIDNCLSVGIRPFAQSEFEQVTDTRSNQINLNGAGVSLYMQLVQDKLYFMLIGDQLDCYKDSVDAVTRYLKEQHRYLPETYDQED